MFSGRPPVTPHPVLALHPWAPLVPSIADSSHPPRQLRNPATCWTSIRNADPALSMASLLPRGVACGNASVSARQQQQQRSVAHTAVAGTSHGSAAAVAPQAPAARRAALCSAAPRRGIRMQAPRNTAAAAAAGASDAGAKGAKRALISLSDKANLDELVKVSPCCYHGMHHLHGRPCCQWCTSCLPCSCTHTHDACAQGCDRAGGRSRAAGNAQRATRQQRRFLTPNP